PVAVLVGADPALRTLREVEAFLAETDLLLHFADRLAERQRLLVRGAKQVEGEPLGGPPADPRQPRELGDEARQRRRPFGAQLVASRTGGGGGFPRPASRRGRRRPCRR